MKSLIIVVAVGGAALGLVGCDDAQPDSGLPAIDVSHMTVEECEAVRRMSLKQGVPQAEVDRRVKCPGR